MALQIIDQPDDMVDKIKTSIESAIQGAQVEVSFNSPGHFEIHVVSEQFAGKTLVKQQQLVYGAITPLMAGDQPPVHAVDRLETRVP